MTGTEIRGCWEAWPAGEPLPDAPLTIGPARPAAGPHTLEFVEVGAGSALGGSEVAPADQAPVAAPATVVPAGEPGWSLWGDPDR